MSTYKLSRRIFLKSGAVAAFAPLEFLLNGLCKSFVQNSYAEQSGKELPRNYVLIYAPGAIAKWAFDNPLRPFKDSPFEENPYVCTKISNLSNAPSQMKFEYATVNLKGIEMPYLWKFDVPAPDGKWVPMHNLLDHMIMIRGCRMGSDGHGNSLRKTVAPVPGGYSLSGMVADGSNSPIPALNLIGYGDISTSVGMGYKAPNGTSLLSVTKENKNIFEYLFRPFSSQKADPFGGKKDIEGTIDKFLDLHQRAALSQDPNLSSLFKDRKNAKAILKEKIYLMSVVYDGLVQKYQSLIERSLRDAAIPGVFDRPIPGFLDLKNVRAGKIYDRSLGNYANKEFFLGNGDMRNLFKLAEIPHLAEQFAITEFLLTQKLGTFIGINLEMLGNLHYENGLDRDQVERIIDKEGLVQYKISPGPKPNLYTGISPRNIFHYDAHNVGTIPNLLSCTLVFRALASCILELISKLKGETFNGKNLFEETLIQFSTEFGRDPRPDCAGSEHGWNGYSTSLYSGIFKGPEVIGNIYTTSKNTGSFYQKNGTWGDGAPIDGLNGNSISIRNIATSIAGVLRVEPPVQNTAPLLEVDGERVKILIERAKNITP